MTDTFPPDVIFAVRRFGPHATDVQQRELIPALSKRSETDSPSMHRTDTLDFDFDFVLDGDIWLEVDDGAAAHLRRGDVVVHG